jgi:hypothetical protein
MIRRLRAAGLSVILILVCSATATAIERPKWMDEPGIVMAGSWEEPSFRARCLGRLDYQLPPDKEQLYARERSAQTIAQLKALGVNFLMIYCYKGAGHFTERRGMEDARQFAAAGRRAGMRIGTYIGGTMLYERLFQEQIEAPTWQARGPHGEPLYYHPQQQFRYAAVRNHPGFIEYLKVPVRFAVEEVRTDLVHFDNFGCGAASYDAYSQERFRAYLEARGKPPADPPVSADPRDPLVRDWADYKCQALAEHYAEMSRFIRGLNPACAVECNPGGVGGGSGAAYGIDHARLLPLGNAFWDENYGADWSPKQRTARTRIRSLKVGRLFGNSTFLYCESPLDLAESMAFNENCLGSISWFEWGQVRSAHLSGKPIPPEVKTYVRFFLDHQDLFRHTPPVADVAVLRTFAEQAFGHPRAYAVEQGLIQAQAAWRIIFDQQLDALADYRVLVAPDDTWLSADQRRKLAGFAARGGLVVRSAAIKDPAAFPATLHDRMRVACKAPPSVALELCRQSSPRRVLVHLVNYDAAHPIDNLRVSLRLKSGRPPAARLLSPDPAGEVQRPVGFDDGWLSVTVPRLKVYATLVFDDAGV